MITFKNLLLDIPHDNSQFSNVCISGIGLNSQTIEKDHVFIALQGQKSHGLDFVDKAISRGAALVLSDKKPIGKPIIPIVFIKNLTRYLPILARRVYPIGLTKIIGVTGTNGKSTVVSFVAQLLGHMGIACASIGTLGVQVFKNGALQTIASTSHTTPDIFSLYKILSKLNSLENIQYVAIEVSSHALVQNRLAGLEVQTAIFTNLSQDHLDYHGTMADYFSAKQQLFLNKTLKTAVINQASSYASQLLASTNADNMVQYGLDDIQKLTLNQKGFSGEIDKQLFIFNCLGGFNLENLLAAVACIKSLGFVETNITPHLYKLKLPLGRMQQVENQPIWIDYAHTPDALNQSLSALSQHNPNKNIVVLFGCGGNRDKGKRSKMGKVAAQLAHKIILTNDNPRDEPPIDIVADIQSGTKGKKLSVIYNREEAIAQAITQLQGDECLLIAGKGHENTQIIGKNIAAFNDHQIAKKYVC